jgi:hypothetical protein
MCGCVCVGGFCNVWVYVCVCNVRFCVWVCVCVWVGFVMSGCMYVLVSVCVCVCNVRFCVCVCVGGWVL